MYFRFILLCAITLLAVSCGKKLPVSMITATSMESGLPFDILSGQAWRPEKGASFVKLHVYPDDAFTLSKIEINSCGGNFSDVVTAYINFDEYSQDLTSDGAKASVSFETPRNARSVTFNFHKNTDLCIDKVVFYDEKGSKLNLKAPKVVEASVKASETAKPYLSYDAMNLFDSRYEYAWASDDHGVGVTLDFDFKEEQKIESLKIWNGYQRSDVHCFSNGRLKEATLTGDNGYQAKVAVEDILGPQTVKLEKPFKGKHLRLTVDSIYKGKTYKGLVLSEIRFFDGDDWVLASPIEQVKKIAKENSLQFTAAGANGVLNWSFIGGELYGDIPVSGAGSSEAPDSQAVAEANPTPSEDFAQPESSNWTLRLRTDGSMFLEGNTRESDGATGTNRSFFALGNFEVKEAKPDNLKLRIFGFVRTFTEKEYNEDYYGGDCNGCGRDCNMANDDPNKKEKIFQEFIRIKKVGNKLYVQNENPNKIFHFKTLELNNE
ncbi:hypothetical protein CH373_05465 [Leptospira perolatii]|uniref:NAD glycohydrolase translocation F5/8 type C domain-containing protein n=1 Tax=Leptospira perolatii TaxID=2023191 RepID=A0A2M9ZQM4_9LEPT|nr:discoidin domain-containing protein [Leptospira perolatii]PJZ70518.1 hypothetical protein CH360_05885 [Leptospira perolatii]PJZ74354.1 hypothetical protein CH373_05465 [Leptospira perolatii]